MYKQTNYIKIIFRGSTYGPIQSPSSFSFILKMLKVSIRASPVLQSLATSEGEKIVIISNEMTQVTSGLYILNANPNVLYDEKIDGPLQDLPLRECVNKNGVSSIQTQTDLPYTSVKTQDPSHTLPLAKSEMDKTVEGMLHLISSIPPRYIKYNKVLSQQIDTSLGHIQEWSDKLDDLYKKVETSQSGLHLSGVSYSTYLTFVQYRILTMMNDIWKKVWIKFAPSSRVFSVSKIYTLNTLEAAEHILNCLSSWRRMLDPKSWSNIKYHSSQQASKVAKTRPVTAKDRMLDPSRLVSDEHAGDLTILATNREEAFHLANNNELNVFRVDFLKKVGNESAYKNEHLKRIMKNMMQDREYYSEPLSRFIEQSIAKEFRFH